MAKSFLDFTMISYSTHFSSKLDMSGPDLVTHNSVPSDFFFNYWCYLVNQPTFSSVLNENKNVSWHGVGVHDWTVQSHTYSNSLRTKKKKKNFLVLDNIVKLLNQGLEKSLAEMVEWNIWNVNQTHADSLFSVSFSGLRKCEPIFWAIIWESMPCGLPCLQTHSKICLHEHVESELWPRAIHRL